jgi:uncharacterized membrane protein
MIVFALKLLLAHAIGDFVLQPYKWVKDKEVKKHKSKHLYYHTLIHLLLLLIVLEFNFELWPYILIITITHLGIDIGKLNLKNKKNDRALFLIDQILHLAVIAGVVLFRYSSEFYIENMLTKEVILIILALIMLTRVSSITMQVIMSKWKLSEDQPENALQSAGSYIGILERLFIFLFVVLGQWSAIGFLITAKSVFRFGDLSRAKDRKLTEYILIGTLCSFMIAIGIGLAFNYLIKL